MGTQPIAIAIGCVPILLLVLRNALKGHSTLGIVGGTLRTTHGALLNIANYVWQLYLPHLPGTHDYFPGQDTTRQIWFDGYVGRLGWLDTFFPGWAYTVALVLAIPILALCIRSLALAREDLRARLPELATYALMALGLLVLVGVSSYRGLPGQIASYGQARYLLPLLPLLGVLIALAARGAGRRWGPLVGALLIVLFVGHDVLSQLQLISRYYG